MMFIDTQCQGKGRMAEWLERQVTYQQKRIFYAEVRILSEALNFFHEILLNFQDSNLCTSDY